MNVSQLPLVRPRQFSRKAFDHDGTVTGAPEFEERRIGNDTVSRGFRRVKRVLGAHLMKLS
jgi:hypothetical protein